MSQTLRSWLPMQFGSPVIWEGALDQEHLGMHGISSALAAPGCTKPGGILPWVVLPCFVRTDSYPPIMCTQAEEPNPFLLHIPQALLEGGAHREMVPAGMGRCSTPILRLIFVSLPFVFLLSGLQRMLYVRSSSPWQKPALKDWDYNKSCAVKCLNSSPHSLLSSSRHA